MAELKDVFEVQCLSVAMLVSLLLPWGLFGGIDRIKA